MMITTATQTATTDDGPFLLGGDCSAEALVLFRRELEAHMQAPVYTTWQSLAPEPHDPTEGDHDAQ